MARMTGKVAFITGAAKWLGAAIATAFTGEGARVFLADVDADGFPSRRAATCLLPQALDKRR